MSVIRPFSALRPKKEYASAVAALPYDVMNSEEAREKVKDLPYSFIHVDKAEVDLPVGTDIYSDAVYAKAAENLKKLMSFYDATERAIYDINANASVSSTLISLL